MQNISKIEQLLECLIHVIGRAAIQPEEVAKIVGSGPKQVEAFNLCNGKNSQQKIAQKTGLNQGNVSRTFTRWVEAGVAFWIGEGKNACLLHVYPISQTECKNRTKNKN
jgi:hypothetical protein